ncbi:nuclease-related domain-containing protein [Desulfosporosinus sp. Sb-LF]|uniref:nuclease-related domain-containing protein n=1 Tax=Desulfosporosinus sp. Sb-LF TaxID=2560027 RepID=UPI00107F5C04|nr:nuclease-related domain-containing protein [Desulfosporosinus sp. Sb-LF]TGE34258.1 NERD domain-containing protein [Desulfosporosinus sp. Sb-LF]
MFLSKLFKRVFQKDSLVSVQPTMTTKTEISHSSLEKEKNRKALRKGELGEYKIDIQLDQLPKNYKYVSNLLLPNPKAHSGYSQIDHVVISPYGLFVIETKNYSGEISGSKQDKVWFQNGKYQFLNPLWQNYGHIATLKVLLANFKSSESYFSIISFTRRSIFKVDTELRKITSSELIIYDTELSDFITRKVAVLSRGCSMPILNDSDIVKIYEVLSDKNIKDEQIRLEHVQKNGTRKKEHQQPNKSDNNWNKEKCSICSKPVSEKVRNFCLANKKRFDGKVYCFDHQSNF